ncbi:hypothetical protein BsWGS_22987 [Bradybaena similaris]
MYTQLLLAITTLSFTGSHGFFNPMGRRGSQPPVCRLPSKPCRLQVVIRSVNGSQESEMSTHTCSCASPNSCSSDWSRSSHVISRNLLSTSNNITMNMMFCQAVQPQQWCANGEEALVLSGSLTIPYDVESYNCRCSDSYPLLLKERTMGSDYRYYHKYVCDCHMPTCVTAEWFCATNIPDGIRYDCKCPSNQHCRFSDPYDDSIEHASCST